jgi:hypothetical protein
MPTLWKIACMEHKWPGMWQRWFKNQCVAVGWAAKWGFKLNGKTKGGRGWSAARNAIKRMELGDYVVVALRGHRVGRLGEITGKAIGDDEWNPLVPKGPGLPDGEMGRRIFVRWDLTVGPDNQDLVIQLPADRRFSSGELRGTAVSVKSITLESLCKQMNDPENWINLLGKFSYEKALSDYIANYPNRLEDGLLPYPNAKIRERVFKNRTRLDVLLVDRQNRPVIVECKQYAPTSRDLKQLRQYMKQWKDETKQQPRGILVHGGAAKLPNQIIEDANKSPSVEIVNYGLDVTFRPSGLASVY